ncbi:phosphoadenosine phosphosulfate reductase family protein [Tamlana sp. 2_MG-2023]|uniref:phosphoadenosine phosphosulfate reductase domain-containing protein n=1 Tax=unclassified Tamlana TaxID=2614803 RepID=UPI0026E1A032|nr:MULTISPECIES: phosphoadenosine phosphosulfate reductase family protein [unclassified Tamlana]MDO6760713.1 phosphoadenosine phosphosulfate reductase family protein [Tamlana sp. 2_MG-2023]MDO6790969.1 phosphoadenosine phosphosulfate reductase family protein [Tamlana sp. 1_MG-2023]
MFTENQIEELNKAFKDAAPADIIKKALELNNEAVVTTNFRPYEAVILHAVNAVASEIPVIWCDTGYNTPQTYKHAEEVIKDLALNVFLYVPKQTSAHRDVVMGIPTVDAPEHALFTEQVKLEPFTRAMAEHKPKVWFTNLRQGQTAFRNSIGIFSLSKDGVLKVSPFYFWSDEKLDGYLKQNNLPNEFKYFDPTKALENRECGLHA